MHGLFQIVDAPKIDENKDSEVIEFRKIMHYMCFTWWDKIPWNEQLSEEEQTHHHTTTCRKKEGVACRFNAPCAPSVKTQIVDCEEKTNETVVKHSKKSIYKVFYIITICDLSDVTLSEILECGVTQNSIKIH